jgi:sarcosine oxidase subunit alpha
VFDHAYFSTFEFVSKGAKVTVVDSRNQVSHEVIKKCEELKIGIHLSHSIIGTFGQKKINAVEIQKTEDEGKKLIGSSKRLDVDLVLMSGGWNPAVQLFSQSRGKLKYDYDINSFVPDQIVQDQKIIGCNNGNFDLSFNLENGFQSGLEVAKELGKETEVENPKFQGDKNISFVSAQVEPYMIGKKEITKGSKQFVDFQNDVTAADIFLAQREGYISVEHTKRYTTTGMGTDQGKTSNVNALALMSHIHKKPVEEIGHTTFRPPISPQTIGAIAGRSVDSLFDPVRKTSVHKWHEENGAVFEDVGQ